ncbi:hypothetical protein SKA34_05080 [Photobacterium sp. SKA34]|nr:hypothetical protein SKA34_05080 [Photobacterium sp. SKA34]
MYIDASLFARALRFNTRNSCFAKWLSIEERSSLYSRIEPSISSLRLVKLSMFKPSGKSYSTTASKI